MIHKCFLLYFCGIVISHASEDNVNPKVIIDATINNSTMFKIIAGHLYTPNMNEQSRYELRGTFQEIHKLQLENAIDVHKYRKPFGEFIENCGNQLIDINKLK